MSLGIPGISNLPGGLGPLGSPTRTGGGREAEAARTDADPRRAESVATGRNTASSNVPPGTDPELWAVLTTEERAHFTRLRSMGPLTYSTSSSAGPQQPSQARRGVRLDVRV